MNAYPEKQQYTADDLVAIIAILRDPDCGCPWDKVQTHTSIRMNFLEEAYEAVDAIDLNDPSFSVRSWAMYDAGSLSRADRTGGRSLYL